MLVAKFGEVLRRRQDSNGAVNIVAIQRMAFGLLLPKTTNIRGATDNRLRYIPDLPYLPNVVYTAKS